MSDKTCKGCGTKITVWNHAWGTDMCSACASGKTAEEINRRRGSYYIRPPKSDQILGPYSVADIASQLQDHAITEDFTAHKESGETLNSVRQSNAWIPVTQVFAQPIPPEPDTLLSSCVAQTPESRGHAQSQSAGRIPQSGGFDFRKLTAFIMVLGFIALAYGVIQYSRNQLEQHVQAKQTSGENTVRGLFDSVNSSMEAQDANYQIDMRNMDRIQARDTAKKVIIAGAITLFLGIGVAVSAGKKSG